jgi:hypothetical protein
VHNIHYARYSRGSQRRHSGRDAFWEQEIEAPAAKWEAREGRTVIFPASSTPTAEGCIDRHSLPQLVRHEAPGFTLGRPGAACYQLRAPLTVILIPVTLSTGPVMNKILSFRPAKVLLVAPVPVGILRMLFP